MSFNKGDLLKLTTAFLNSGRDEAFINRWFDSPFLLISFDLKNQPLFDFLNVLADDGKICHLERGYFEHFNTKQER